MLEYKQNLPNLQTSREAVCSKKTYFLKISPLNTKIRI